MFAKYIKVLHAPDGADYFKAFKDAFSHRPDICVDDNLADEPAAYQSVVFVFLLTPAALAATELAARLRTLYTASFPILPVVERLADHRFDTLPESLALLRRLNAVGWYMDETAPGTEVIKACEHILGLGQGKQPGGDCMAMIIVRVITGVAWMERSLRSAIQVPPGRNNDQGRLYCDAY
jgi:hypothetical protein